MLKKKNNSTIMFSLKLQINITCKSVILPRFLLKSRQWTPPLIIYLQNYLLKGKKITRH